MPIYYAGSPGTPFGSLGLLGGSSSGMVAYAAQRTEAVDQYIYELSNTVLSLVAPAITPEFPTGASAPAIEVPTPPTFTAPVWVAPGFPTAFTGVLDTGDLQIDPFDDNPPVINYGVAPPPFTGTIPDAPGINLNFADPTLSISLPAAPDLLSLNVRPFEGINLPTFDGVDPVLTAVEPSIREYTPGQFYTSELLTATQGSLEDRITNGGTGLNQQVENAIWDRGREREALAQRDAILKLEQMEALGYALPPGVYLDARLKIITETDYAERGHSREVMIKSAELELDNVKHALSTATDLEAKLMDYTNSVEQRVFEATRYATEAGVSIYNAKVQAYAQMVDVYRAKVQIYEAKIRAEVSRVEAYRAEVSAEEAKASINRTLVDQYKVQVDVALSNIEIFKAELSGIQTKAEIEKTKVMVFGEQVRGYVAQINAYTAGVEGFRATVQAEQTKQQVYQSQVEAFTARVNASARQIESRIAAYKGQIDAKSAEYDGYRAAVSGESARIEGISRINTSRAEVYRSQVAANSAYNEVLIKQWQATLDQNQRVTEIGISAAKANAELYITTRSLAIDASKTGATVSAQLGAAALNAVNYSTSVNDSRSTSDSRSSSTSANTSVSSSNSSSNSTSHNYNYNASV